MKKVLILTITSVVAILGAIIAATWLLGKDAKGFDDEPGIWPVD